MRISGQWRHKIGDFTLFAKMASPSLEYGLLLVGSGRFMIFHIDGRSNKFELFVTYLMLINKYCKWSYLGIVCWNPWRYSCSKAGTTNWRRFQREASNFRRAGGAGSRHSGKNTMKDRGSKVSSSNRSKCTMVASINSSQNGGLASKEPQCGLNSKMGLYKININHYILVQTIT